ncbi:MAG: hypothetical protein KAH32_03920 [Chlamydiia bacterium]|nr:hypothetical protein [Chlamydiia bacterium]
MIEYKKFWTSLLNNMFIRLVCVGSIVSCAHYIGDIDVSSQYGLIRMYNNSHKNIDNKYHEGFYCNARYIDGSKPIINIMDLMFFSCSENKYGEKLYDGGIFSKMESLYPDFFSKHGSLGVFSSKGFFMSKSINIISKYLSSSNVMSLIGVGGFIDFKQSDFLPSSSFSEYFSGIGRTIYFGSGIEFKVYSSCKINSRFLVTPSLGICINMLGYVFYDLEEFVDKNKAYTISTDTNVNIGVLETKIMGSFSCLATKPSRVSPLGIFPKFKISCPIVYKVSKNCGFVLSFDFGMDLTTFKNSDTNIGFYVPRGHQCIIPIDKTARGDDVYNNNEKFLVVDNTAKEGEFQAKLVNGTHIQHSLFFNSSSKHDAYVFRVKNNEKIHGFMFGGVAIGLVYQY